MLLEFSVDNYLSFHHYNGFSMLPNSSYKEFINDNTTFTGGKRAPLVLNSAAIFGANGSGKTNLFRAMDIVRDLVISEDGGEVVEKAGANSLSDHPVKFTMLFLTKGTIFDFYVTIKDGVIIYEKLDTLVNAPKRQWRTLYERNPEFADGIKFGNTLKGERQAAFKETDAHCLFLNSLHIHQNPSTRKASDWLANDLIPVIRNDTVELKAIRRIHNELKAGSKSGKLMLKIIRASDMGITGILFSDQFPTRSMDVNGHYNWKADVAFVTKPNYGVAHQNKISYTDTPSGTKELLRLLPVIIDTLRNGSTLIVDNFAANLHPRLALRLLELFHDPQINQNGAQLIFSTNDTYFATEKIFRRDQMWFIEKNAKGASELVALQDFEPRNDHVISLRYHSGYFGALPRVDLKSIFNSD